MGFGVGIRWIKAVLYLKVKMSRTLSLKVSTRGGRGAEVRYDHQFPQLISLFLVFCPYDENEVLVTDKECECSEVDSLRCHDGETCVKPRDSSGVAECQVPCSNPAWDEANNIERPDPDHEYLLGEHSFTCAEDHYVMTQKVIFVQRIYLHILLAVVALPTKPRLQVSAS